METQVLDSPAARLAPVDVVRAAYAAYNRGELDEGRRYLALDVEWILPSWALHGDVLRGRDAVVRELESEFKAFSRIRRDLVGVRQRGERVLAVVSASLRGRHSGIELQQRTLHAFTVRDGVIVRVEELPASQPARSGSDATSAHSRRRPHTGRSQAPRGRVRARQRIAPGP
jgi:ketosteroid isomerase-like protein